MMETRIEVARDGAHIFHHRELRVRLCPETMRAEIARPKPAPCPPAPRLPAPARADMPVATIVLVLTQACNLRCRYCYGDAGRFGAGGLMSRETALAAVDWLFERSANNKTLRIGFMGGEPFLNFDALVAAVLHAEARAADEGKRLHFYTTTNGTRMDAAKTRFLREHQLEVQMSVDGPRAVHDRNRPFADGSGSFDTIAAGARRLLAALPGATGHAVIAGGSDPRAARAAMAELGFREITMLPVTGSLFGDVEREHAAEGAALEALLDLIAEDAEAWLAAIRARDTGRLDALGRTTSLASPLRALLYDIKSRHACGAGLGLVGISADGRLYPCQRFVGMEAYRIGDISGGAPTRAAHLASALTESPACASCFARYYCAGGCKHDNAATTGDMRIPAPHNCRLRRRELEVAAWVVAQLTAEHRAFAATTQALPPKPCPLDL